MFTLNPNMKSLNIPLLPQLSRATAGVSGEVYKSRADVCRLDTDNRIHNRMDTHT